MHRRRNADERLWRVQNDTTFFAVVGFCFIFQPYRGYPAKLGRHEQAIAHYEQALASNPNYTHAHINLGSALAALGRNDEAVAQYEKALHCYKAWRSVDYAAAA